MIRTNLCNKFSIFKAEQIKNKQEGSRKKETYSIYTGSPFLKGYVQSSLPHKQRKFH